MTDPALIAPTWNERGSIIRPRSPAFWLFVFLLTVGTFGSLGKVPELIGESSFTSGAFADTPGIALLAMTLMIVWAIPVVIFTHALDLFEREPFSMLAAAFAWGYLAATNLVVPANVSVEQILAKLGSADLADRWSAAISAPVAEETLKGVGLVLLVLIAAAEIDTPIDGLVYGAFIGLGFQIEEDFWYMVTRSHDLGDVGVIFFDRAIAGGIWGHAAFTGLVGLGIGYLVSRPDIPRPRRISYVVLACAGAWAMHFLWNTPWLDDVYRRGLSGVVAYGIIKGLPGVLLVAALYFHARRREARWVDHVLAPEVPGGAVTPEEIKTLLTLRRRRHARKAAKHSGGRRAARRTKELQQEQVALAVDLTRSGGATTPEIERHRATIAHLREVLQPPPAKPPPA